MKNLRAHVGDGAMVMFTSKNGERIGLPLVRIGKEWKSVGVYIKYGVSASDPSFGSPFALPMGWKPNAKILRAIKQAS